MDHNKYHMLRKSTEQSYDSGDVTGLAAIIEAGDSLYNSNDWTTWGDNERVVFGIMTGIKITKPDVHVRVFEKSREAELCAAILGDKKAVMEIAKFVWAETVAKETA